MKYKLKVLLGLLMASTIVLVFNLLSAQAASCTTTSSSDWYPGTYNYNDSSLSLNGKSEICWSDGTYKHRGYSYGAVNAGGGGTVPLAKIKTFNESWESISTNPYPSCYDNGDRNSGWKYNTYSVWSPDRGYTPYHCSGGSYHYYVGHTIHYFGATATAETGNR